MSIEEPLLIRTDRKTEEPSNDDGLGEKTAQFGFRKVPEKEKARWVRNHFDSIARKYDVMNTLLSVGIHYLWKRIAVRMLGLSAGDTVLDVCGGTGDLSILALKRVGPTGRVILYDINLAMMEAGRDKPTHRETRKKIIFVQGDAESVACGDSTFDAVMVGFGVRNLTHMEQGFREMFRILKPGGRFMCLEFSRPTTPWFRWLYDLYSFRVMPFLGLVFAGSRQPFTYLPESIRMFPLPAELSRLLEEIGFRTVSYRRLTNGIAVVHVGEKPR